MSRSFDMDYARRRLEESRKSQVGPPEMQVDLTEDFGEALAELDNVNAERGRLAAAIRKIAHTLPKWNESDAMFMRRLQRMAAEAAKAKD